MQVGLGPGHTVLDGAQLPLTQSGTAPQFSAYIWCGQMAEWIKMPLGMEVGLGPGDFVLDGNPASSSPKRGWSPPISGPCLLWPNGWMDQDGTWHGGGPRSRPHCARWGPSYPKRGHNLPIFSPCLLWPNGCMYQDTTRYGDRLQPSNIVLDTDPAPPP